MTTRGIIRVVNHDKLTLHRHHRAYTILDASPCPDRYHRTATQARPNSDHMRSEARHRCGSSEGAGQRSGGCSVPGRKRDYGAPLHRRRAPIRVQTGRRALDPDQASRSGQPTDPNQSRPRSSSIDKRCRSPWYLCCADSHLEHTSRRAPDLYHKAVCLGYQLSLPPAPACRGGSLDDLACRR